MVRAHPLIKLPYSLSYCLCCPFDMNCDQGTVARAKVRKTIENSGFLCPCGCSVEASFLGFSWSDTSRKYNIPPSPICIFLSSVAPKKKKIRCKYWTVMIESAWLVKTTLWNYAHSLFINESFDVKEKYSQPSMWATQDVCSEGVLR